MTVRAQRITAMQQRSALLNRTTLARSLLILVLLAAFLLQTRSQWRLIQVGVQPFLIGDWLISYAGGFVRRGLFGSILTAVTDDMSVALALLFAMQTMMYLVMFGIAARWVIALPGPRDWAVVFLSPAFLLFGLGDFLGTHRKEIIALSALFILAEWVRTDCRSRFALPIVLLLFSLAVFSHEANALLLAPFVILLKQAYDEQTLSRRAAVGGAAALALTSLTGVVTAIAAPGTTTQRTAICDDLLARGFDEALCGGSIAYIGQGGREALLSTAAALPNSGLFAILALFALAPFALTPWARSHRALLFTASAPILPLFLLGIDWGRWIVIAATVSTTLVIVGSSREGSRPDRIPLPWMAVFILAWRIPHYNATTSALGPSGLLTQSWGFLIERVDAVASALRMER